jgi:VCBS repeat-containing protein
MRFLYESSGLSRIALGLQAWPRTVLRGSAGAPDSSAEYESLFPARNWWEFPNLSVAGVSPSAFTEIAEARFAGVTAAVRSPTPAADEPAMSRPNVLLGSIPSAAIAPTPIGSSTPPPAVAAICGCGYFLAPTQVLDQLAANAAHVHLSGQVNVSGGADFLMTGQTGVMGASVSAQMSLQNVAPIKDWQLVGGGNLGSETGQVGVLSGSVTTPTAPSTTTTTSSNLVAAATSTNPIVLENQKQGTPQSVWDIDGAGSSNIEGFATDISVNVGNRVDFKINTDSSNYRIEIYRLGYYGGDGARLVTTIQHTGVQNQDAPLRDATTGMVDAGNWNVSASWDVPADSVSGVYIAKLVRQDGTFGENQIPFIVRDDSSTSDVVFQTSDMTWQAYNGWGGANFYGGNGPATGQGAGRAYAVSYNRPIATRAGVGTVAGPQDYLFGAEYAAIYWLEQNGYDVSYMAGVDTDRYGSLLLNHKMYLDVGHDEYWSGQQRANVQAARDAGVNLSFWSGNEMYWRTRWGDSISSDSTAYRTLISYKETWANSSIDPSDQWTGTFRDPRFSPPATGGGVPENALIGQMFQVDDVGQTNLQAIAVPYDDANLRFWRNTSIANLQQGQTATLTQNYLGYEWDESPDNGFDPDGLVRLSSTTLPVNTYLLDYGNTVGAGVSTHSLTLYRAPSGALVFGAGTVYWSWGLSDNHDLAPTPTDSRVQQAMVNLLADMGIQPGTLQSGLVAATASTDLVAPTSTINPIASFSAQSVVTISGTAADLGGGVIGAVEVSTDGGLTWNNAIGDENWTYSWSPQVAGTYTIKSRAVDDSINLETPSAGRTVVVTAPSYLTLFSGSSTPAIVNATDAGAVELGVKFQTSVSGTLSGIRFYKSSQDTGTHTGELWTSTGTLLATATFTNETASGWQSVTFSNPVTLTPNTTYVASYHTNVGHYAVNTNYFTTNVVSGPLTAPADGNGVYAYGGMAFPTGTFSGENYWVDVMFTPSTVNGQPVAANDVGPTIAQNLAATIAATSLTVNDSDPDGDALNVIGVSAATHGTVVLNTQPNPQNNTITFTPDIGYTGPASFSYTVSDGRGGTATANVNFTVVPAGAAPVSLFSSSNTPAQTGLNDGAQLEVGMKFTSSVSGQITALKFYRNASDTGTNVLDLWTSTGTLLGSATFSNTAASGWQTVTLSSAVSIAPNTTYIASYHTTGAYVATTNYFTTAVTNGPLTAPSTTTIAGGNGVYAYGGTGATGIFPTNTYGASNYWVDVVFTPSTGGNIAPTAVADVGDATERGGVNNGTVGVAATGNVLTNDTDPDAGDTKTVSGVSFGATAGTLGAALTGAHGSLVLGASGAFTYTVNETDPAVQALRLSTNTITDVFNYTMRDTAGTTSQTTLTITIHGANDAPVLTAQTGDQNTTIGSTFSLALPADTFTDVDSGDTLTYAAVASDGSALPAWLTFNPTTRTFSGTPSSTGTVGVKVSATDLAGFTANETFNIVVTPSTVSLFSSSDTPAVLSDSDTSQVNLGVQFTSSSSGIITGIKYYKGTNDTGTHTGSLWSSTGTLLATATFTNETASGWQTLTFSNPVAISAGTTYVASYHSNGHYAATGNYFATGRVNGPLTAPAGNNGVYAYGTANLFPTGSFGATNYWVDVMFSPASGGTNQAPVAVNDTGFSVTQNSSMSIAASTLLANDTDADGDPLTITGASDGVHGTAGFNAQSNTLSFTPDAGYTGPASFSYTISDGRGGTASASVSLAVNAASANIVSLFSSDSAPTITAVNDPNSVELGLKFQASSPGEITGLSFYKAASNTGAHVANLWTSTGTLLASATFTNETATGWQQVNFATPVPITEGTTYVASYHTSGNYAADPGLFNSAVNNGLLTAPSSASSGGNGVYAYGSSSLFPANSYNSTSYGVDVLFRQLVA